MAFSIVVKWGMHRATLTSRSIFKCLIITTTNWARAYLSSDSDFLRIASRRTNRSRHPSWASLRPSSISIMAPSRLCPNWYWTSSLRAPNFKMREQAKNYFNLKIEKFPTTNRPYQSRAWNTKFCQHPKIYKPRVWLTEKRFRAEIRVSPGIWSPAWII